MSILLQRLNTIRKTRQTSWLTASQLSAMHRAVEQIRTATPVNLYGHVGVGKTFLAWFLADQLEYTYVVHPSRLSLVLDSMPARGVVVDNCSSERFLHRKVLRELSYRGINYGAFVTRKALEDYGYSIQVTLSEEDLAHVRCNLAARGITTALSNTHDLWTLINYQT